ncbi:hypothetical protein BMF77_02249 [Dolichospermum sp. UHCC 0315A]|uniref:caspase family protein n=1 Tax=Dolichospermum sp. UHCC 0315A TaxID=1914871 RepID=UPI0011E8438A|nr:caspase family protein [Dolichospermum sp. UHCC 0315A]QEI41656.1 hypothetical protein BMF77_02249 [Dolichospermum sp. UHCC 0315A]
MVKVALLIGVSEYEPGLNSLPASVKDVQAIAKVLQNPEMGGFAESDIQKLENPDPQTMQEAIEGLFSDRHKDDLAIVYFSGHGIKDESGKLYLATRLTRKNPQGQLIKSTSVPASFIHDIMGNSRCKRQVIILDCCFSGAFAEGWSAKEDGTIDIQTQLGGEGRAVLTSSTSTQYSFQQPGENLSTYTRYIVEGIETGAADLDNDGVISVDELHEYAKKKVKEASPAMLPEIYAVKEGFKILLAKTPIGDPKLRYRKEFETYASRGEISVIGRKILDTLGQNLGLRTEETTVIESDVLNPYREYQQKLKEYQQALTNALENEKTLSDNIRHELRRYQEILGLRDEDIEKINASINSQQKASLSLDKNLAIDESQNLPQSETVKVTNTPLSLKITVLTIFIIVTSIYYQIEKENLKISAPNIPSTVNNSNNFDFSILDKYKIFIYYKKNITSLSTNADMIKQKLNAYKFKGQITTREKDNSFFKDKNYPQENPPTYEIRYEPNEENAANILYKFLTKSFPSKKFTKQPIGDPSENSMSIFLGE